MATRLGRRFISQVARPTARVARTVNATGRRCMSTAEHGAHPTGSDTPWMIGSALVFGPALIYLLYPSSKKSSHTAAHTHGAHDEHHEKQEPEAPAEQEETQEEAPASEEKQDSVTDADGETVSGEEVKESIQQAASNDLPPDAQAQEEQDAKFSSGSPGMTSEAESKPDQKEEPQTQSHTGTLQSDEDSGPTNIGDARQAAASGEAPKEAKDN
ncbi:hypothetical protein IEO21_09184 [Rhodonia placenta]|uniref:Uncharacterized protein n=1 Tax=Rhodonia placenta TaxID=104341 RepID=A0A8H7NUR4_9APHY|nr:hypothetical protein IEO21_09184 [Postia placenta]